MNSKTIETLLGCVLAIAPGACASPLIYNFNTPGTPLGTSQVYTSNGVTITAYGFSNTGSSMQLFAKNDGGDEVGLGLNGTSDDEIGTTNFIQLDLTNVLASHPSSILMSIGSVQGGEGWDIYVSNILGSRGTLLQTGTTDAPATFTLNSIPAGDDFVSVRASGGNVLLSSLATTSSVPEPGSAAMIGAGLLALGTFVKRIR